MGFLGGGLLASRNLRTPISKRVEITEEGFTKDLARLDVNAVTVMDSARGRMVVVCNS
jgi:head-tail adaptor